MNKMPWKVWKIRNFVLKSLENHCQIVYEPRIYLLYTYWLHAALLLCIRHYRYCLVNVTIEFVSFFAVNEFIPVFRQTLGHHHDGEKTRCQNEPVLGFGFLQISFFYFRGRQIECLRWYDLDVRSSLDSTPTLLWT